MPTPPRPSTVPPSTGPQLAAATAILVLGMHRSGTSAVTRMLNLRGAELGRDLLPPKQDNERGFWENRAILELHEALLAGLGLRWLDLVDLPAGWQQTAAARRFVTELPGVLRQQFDRASLFAVKDPRLSLLAPLWIEALTGAGMRPTFVITIRHPLEVAASLARRDGLTTAQAQLLWLQHLVDAERATRGQRRVFVHYERLLADWRVELRRIGEQLALDWPPTWADFDPAVTQFLAPALRHHRVDDTPDAALLPIVAQAYAEAGAAALGPAPAMLFDGLGGGFDALIATVAPLYRELAARHDAAHEAHRREIEQARAAFAVKEDEIARARAAFTAKEDEIARAREAFAIKEEEIARAREAAAVRDADLDAARSSIDALDAELAAARAVIDAKEQEIAAARINIDTRTTELALARDNIHALAGEITVAREAFAAKEREIDAARANIEALAADLEQAREAHALKDRTIDAQREEIAARNREIDAARTHIDALAADIERARAGFAAKDAEIDAARSNIDNLVGQIDAARQAHALRDATEAALRAELQVLRGSRWFRLGRSLRLIDGRDA